MKMNKYESNKIGMNCLDAEYEIIGVNGMKTCL